MRIYKPVFILKVSEEKAHLREDVLKDQIRHLSSRLKVICFTTWSARRWRGNFSKIEFWKKWFLKIILLKKFIFGRKKTFLKHFLIVFLVFVTPKVPMGFLKMSAHLIQPFGQLKADIYVYIYFSEELFYIDYI